MAKKRKKKKSKTFIRAISAIRVLQGIARSQEAPEQTQPQPTRVPIVQDNRSLFFREEFQNEVNNT